MSKSDTTILDGEHKKREQKFLSISDFFHYRFETFTLNFVHPRQNLETFFQDRFSTFHPTPPPPTQWWPPAPPVQWWVPRLDLPHHWTGGAGVRMPSKKSFIFLSGIETSVGHKSNMFCKIYKFFVIACNFKGLALWIWNLASTLTRRPPSWWCPEVAPLRGGRYHSYPEAPLPVVFLEETTARGAREVSLPKSSGDAGREFGVVSWDEKPLHLLIFYYRMNSTFRWLWHSTGDAGREFRQSLGTKET